ncbi:hypothetical protein CLU79DRAFT_732672, partial [Phycomyces nitens]
MTHFYLSGGRALTGVLLSDNHSFPTGVRHEPIVQAEYEKPKEAKETVPKVDDSGDEALGINLGRRGIRSSILNKSIAEAVVTYHLPTNRRLERSVLPDRLIKHFPLNKYPNINRRLSVIESLLDNLKVLNLSTNSLDEFDLQIPMPQLTKLVLSNNGLKNINHLPALLPNLVTLHLDHNSIDRLPENIGEWKKMRRLRLGSVFGGNYITSLPQSVSEMECLELLDLSDNRLVSLPSDMYIPQLTLINLSNNQLKFLPKSLARCPRLESVLASRNRLVTISSDFAGTKRLKILDISFNRICIIPNELLDRHNITVHITDNPMILLPNTVTQTLYEELLEDMADTKRVFILVPRPQQSSEIFPIQEDQDEDWYVDAKLEHEEKRLSGYVGNSLANSSNTARENERALTLLKLKTDIDLLLSSLGPLPYYPVSALREIAVKDTIRLRIPLHEFLPRGITDDLEFKGHQKCYGCKGPYINTWITYILVRGYHGHPRVVRKIRCCSRRCWDICHGKYLHWKLRRLERSIDTDMSLALPWTNEYGSRPDHGTFEWIIAAAQAADEQNAS